MLAPDLIFLSITMFLETWVFSWLFLSLEKRWAYSFDTSIAQHLQLSYLHSPISVLVALTPVSTHT